jgi:hypothetical protein
LNVDDTGYLRNGPVAAFYNPLKLRNVGHSMRVHDTVLLE